MALCCAQILRATFASLIDRAHCLLRRPAHAARAGPCRSHAGHPLRLFHQQHFLLLFHYALFERSAVLGEMPLLATPKWYVCSITMQPMRDPVTLEGHTFDRAGIEQWLATHDTNPLTGLSVSSKSLFPDLSLKARYDDFLEERNVDFKAFLAAVARLDTDALDKELVFPVDFLVRVNSSGDAPLFCALKAAGKDGGVASVDAVAAMVRCLLRYGADASQLGTRAFQHRKRIDEKWSQAIVKCSALHLAAHCNNGDACLALLSAGADANSSVGDQTPLLLCTSTDVAAILVKAGADATAISTNPPECASCIGDTPMHLAARRNRRSMLELLLREQPLAIHAIDLFGGTMLHDLGSSTAAWAAELVTWLIKQGVDPNVERTKKGHKPLSALSVAVFEKNCAVVAALVMGGARTWSTTRNCSAFHELVCHWRSGDDAVTMVNLAESLLTATDANLALSDTEGLMPHHRAFGSGNLILFEFLVVRGGASMSALTSDGRMLAALAPDQTALRCLEELPWKTIRRLLDRVSILEAKLACKSDQSVASSSPSSESTLSSTSSAVGISPAFSACSSSCSSSCATVALPVASASL